MPKWWLNWHANCSRNIPTLYICIFTVLCSLTWNVTSLKNAWYGYINYVWFFSKVSKQNNNYYPNIIPCHSFSTVYQDMWKSRAMVFYKLSWQNINYDRNTIDELKLLSSKINVIIRSPFILCFFIKYVLLITDGVNTEVDMCPTTQKWPYTLKKHFTKKRL